MSTFRRNGISNTIMLRVYNEIARNGKASMLDLRRSLPDYASVNIGKAVNELCDIGQVGKGKDWPKTNHIIEGVKGCRCII